MMSPWAKEFVAPVPPKAKPSITLEARVEFTAGLYEACMPHTAALFALLEERKAPLKEVWATLAMMQGMVRAGCEAEGDHILPSPAARQVFDNLAYEFLAEHLAKKKGPKP